MKTVYKKLSIVAIIGAVLTAQGCGLTASDDCDDDKNPTQRAMLRGMGLGYGLDMAEPAPRPIPPPIPTVETYASCSAMQDDLRADWGNHSHRYHRRDDAPMSRPVRTNTGSRGNGSSGVGVPPNPVEKVLKNCGSTGFSGSSGKKKATAKNSSAPQESGTSTVAAGQASAPAPEASVESGAEVDAAASSGSGGASGSESFTNTQEKGVDEADVIKIGAHHLYVQRGQELVVVSRATLQPIGLLPLPELENVTLYADGDKLIVVGGAYMPMTQEGPVPTETSDPMTSPMSEYMTKVQIYAAADGAIPALAREHLFNGQAYDSRYVNSRLVLVFRDELPWNEKIDDPAILPIKVQNDAVKGIPCDRILKPAVHDFDTRFVKLASVNADDLAEAPRFTAAIGGGDQIYMTATTLYLTKQGVSWDSWSEEANEQLLVTRVDFASETGDLKVSAAGMIRGRVKDQWAFQEHVISGGERVLSVATSTGQLWSYGTNIAQNHLWILRQNETSLEVANAIHDFGTGEDIRSVRYVNDMAYVVTFKKTDPLFAFDLENPLEPKLLGELKIPGFSVYMHPVAEGRLLGIGFDADDQGEFAWYQGLQVSLFDVTDPMNLKRLDVKIIGERGSSSEVTGDHHAFFYDAGLKLAAMPVIELGGKGHEGGGDMASELKFSGAIFFSVGDAALVEAARISHRELMPDACIPMLSQGQWWQNKTRSIDVNRIFLVDGKILTISRLGLMAHDPNALGSPALVKAAFAGAEAICGHDYLYEY